jgi:hypothetical protein
VEEAEKWKSGKVEKWKSGKVEKYNELIRTTGCDSGKRADSAIAAHRIS